MAPSGRAGDVVAAGQRIASVQGAHGTCAVGGCLHWGARRGDVYFDPMQLLAPLGVVRLLPTNGSGPGMGLGVGLAQALDRHMGVELGGGQARVPE